MAYLGFEPVSVLATGATVLQSARSLFSGLFGRQSCTALSDTQRFQLADQLAASALQGDRGAYLWLRCLAGHPVEELRGQPDINPACRSPVDPARCGFATVAARQYAAERLREVEAAGRFRAAGVTVPRLGGGAVLPVLLLAGIAGLGLLARGHR